ncbi:MAG: NUDIX hydrolase [Candidatus Marinimicrobia bacterium]|nr:NUDIX hydrolase [Candidatus Neomarinimicrobiota bacterium]MCF7850577.1 NUDIX hydrolase [Candidatus Neomarinimicrobiota bacterium]MCF7903689.1 NUDIX hydrolase [Candidatus Neomarinimicrobiota bacterium]
MKNLNLTEKRLSRETVFKGRLLHVVRDEAELPNGHLTTREGILHPGAVVIIPFLDEKTLIMERQYRYMPDQIFIELPAGKLDPGEEHLMTGKRELLEETGYVAEKWEFLNYLYPAIGFADEQMALYSARDLSFQGINRDEDEFLEIIEVPLSEALEMVRAGEISDAKTMVGLFWAEKLVKGEWEGRE